MDFWNPRQFLATLLPFAPPEFYYEEFKACQAIRLEEKVSILYLHLSGKDVEELGLGKAPENYEEIIVDKQKGKIWDWRNGNCLIAKWQALKQTDLYDFQLSTCNLDYFSQNKKIFNQMLSTFRFSP